MIEHHIQKDILDRLSTASFLRFSDLKPATLESNLFMYHLKQLITAGLVMQDSDKTYRLTSLGLGYVDTLTLSTGRPRHQPKVVTILALQNRAGKYLLAKRKRQPSIDTWMLPSGKRHFGESPEVHVARELREQLGADAQLHRRGGLDIRIVHDDQIVTHLIAEVYEGLYDGSAPSRSPKFEYQWQETTAPIPMTPGTTELLAALNEGTGDFLLSLDVTAD